MSYREIFWQGIQSLKEIFSKPWYIVLSLATSFVLWFIIVWLPNFSLLKLILTTFSLEQKLKIFQFTFGTFLSNFTLPSQILFVIIALLVGINVSQMVYYFRTKAKLQKAAGVSFFGIIISFFGIGCSACGSIIITSLFGFGATAAVVNFLPLHGLEFTLLSVIILVWSIFYLSYRTKQPLVCAPEVNK